MISIIIPTQNRCGLLETTLNSLVKSNFNLAKFEILIIDNASTDDTRQIFEKVIGQNPEHTIRYYYEPIPGLHSGRQRGVNESTGDVLVFVDDDIIVDENWLSAIDESFQDETVHLVGGRSFPKYEIEPPYWVEYLWTLNDEYTMCGHYSLIEQGEEIKETNPNLVFGLNFSIRKKILIEIGGFHPDCTPKKYQRYQGDGETGLTLKMKEKKLKALYNPNVFVYHTIPKERLTMEYVENRSYYQGVCDSFTNIRKAYLEKRLPPTAASHFQHNTPQQNISEKEKSEVTLEDIMTEMKSLKQEVEQLKRSINNSSQIKRELFERMGIAYQRGYDFHQEEVDSDPKLLKWVLKENYFDFDYTVFE